MEKSRKCLFGFDGASEKTEKGTFIEYGTVEVHNDAGEVIGTSTRAIVEKDDGNVILVHPSGLKFYK